MPEKSVLVEVRVRSASEPVWPETLPIDFIVSLQRHGPKTRSAKSLLSDKYWL